MQEKQQLKFKGGILSAPKVGIDAQQIANQELSSTPLLISDISALQRTIGNQATERLVSSSLQMQEHHKKQGETTNRSIPVSAQQPNLDEWRTLINFTPPDNISRILARRDSSHKGIPYTKWGIQKVEDGYGQINLDYYPVTIKQLPSINGKKMSADSLLQYIRVNINEFVAKDSAHFEGYDKEEIKKWQSPSPLGSIIHIDMGGSSENPFKNPDDGSVVVSDFSAENWTFSTIQTPHDFQHPVSGNRQFGFDKQNDGSVTFYTRGADRASGILDWALSGGVNVVFAKAHKLWLSFQHKIAGFVNTNGGEAIVQAPTSRRYNWDVVKKHYWHPSTKSQHHK